MKITQASRLLLFLFLSMPVFCGCSNETASLYGNCISCHETQMDAAHHFECTTCHRGDSSADTDQLAHTDLISAPAHPDNMNKTCGSCHSAVVDKFSSALHLTIDNKVNKVRTAYGANKPLSDLLAVPIHENIENPLQLADDLLRRRCLRCHLYSSGDEYSGTSHGTGCSACHLEYENSEMESHRFTKYPSDARCLSCHYGNYVGADYYGRFEHDLNIEYRTPYIPGTDTRPYGVEHHQLAPDIHQQQGMVCVDCHPGSQLMQKTASAPQPECIKCHGKKQLDHSPPDYVSFDGTGYIFTSPATGKKHQLPVMTHPAHQEYAGRATCQVCHAQWSFNDTETHLLRSDLDEYDMWSRLTVQGSSELEKLLEHNLDYDNEELPPAVSDKITGDIRPGIWYKGYIMRRWEEPLLGRDENNSITVVRPILNTALSWIDEDENVRFDAHRPVSQKGLFLPYTPHTTGAAGLFYEQRIRKFTASEDKTSRQANSE